MPGKVIDDQGFGDNEQGAAFVAYSNGSAISFSGEQYWHQNSSGVAGASERNDFFARAMATGDFDNDGYSDAVFGVPGENIDIPFPFTQYYDAGMINVVYGSPNGLNSNDTESFTQDTANVLGGVETGDFFGSALAVGDFDRDGYDDLAVGVCAQCTVTDPFNANGFALVDGNPFPNAPEISGDFTASYTVPIGDDDEFFIFTDWVYLGETNFLLYQSLENNADHRFEGGLRAGYRGNDGQFEVAVFARNITDEDNVQGVVDFNNNTAFVNEPRVIGVSLGFNY